MKSARFVVFTSQKKYSKEEEVILPDDLNQTSMDSMNSE
jgi:hypothetical protein